MWKYLYALLSPSVCVCLSCPTTLLWLATVAFSLAWRGEFAQGGETKKQMNEAEIARKMGRNKEKCWEVTPRERPFFWTLGPL